MEIQTENRGRSHPIVALTLGDPAGIGPELIAKLLTDDRRDREAIVVLVGDRWLLQQATVSTKLDVDFTTLDTWDAVTHLNDPSQLYFLAVDTVQQSDVSVGKVSAACGKSVLDVLEQCMSAALKGDVDAICFAPLNKHAMKLSGMPFEDELHFFADYLKVENYFCEFNTLGRIWTSRISSHVPLKEVSRFLSQARIGDAARLIHQCLLDAGNASPKIAVAGFNPHCGDGGMCGTEEIDIIAPAVEALQAEGIPVDGPFPADTVFLKVRDGEFDAVVTMYHDQGQIAIKLLGFEKGVTVQGGLPIPITTPAHGTAFDIAGQNQANVNATVNAFNLASTMGRSRLSSPKDLEE